MVTIKKLNEKKKKLVKYEKYIHPPSYEAHSDQFHFIRSVQFYSFSWVLSSYKDIGIWSNIKKTLS